MGFITVCWPSCKVMMFLPFFFTVIPLRQASRIHGGPAKIKEIHHVYKSHLCVKQKTKKGQTRDSRVINSPDEKNRKQEKQCLPKLKSTLGGGGVPVRIFTFWNTFNTNTSHLEYRKVMTQMPCGSPRWPAFLTPPPSFSYWPSCCFGSSSWAKTS